VDVRRGYHSVASTGCSARLEATKQGNLAANFGTAAYTHTDPDSRNSGLTTIGNRTSQLITPKSRALRWSNCRRQGRN
jgi:hypothetical protein